MFSPKRGQLEAAGETKLGEGLRFAYIPSFHPTRVVRIYVTDGTPVVVGKVLSGRGGYDPGRIAHTTKRALTPDEWRLLQQRLENADVGSKPSSDDRTGLDGAQWIFEGMRNGEYHRHVVWSPGRDFPQFHKAGAYMLELAGILPTGDGLY